jgi:hypothetical protein
MARKSGKGMRGVWTVACWDWVHVFFFFSTSGVSRLLSLLRFQVVLCVVVGGMYYTLSPHFNLLALRHGLSPGPSLSLIAWKLE